MKKIKKLLTIGLAVLLMLGMCFCLTGCGCEPYEVEIWYIKNYTDENGENHNTWYDTIKQERLYSDDITIQYFEDKTFIFKEFDKEYMGTYTYKKGKGETFVSLTFSDGTEGRGTCGKYMFDGVWYEGTLQAFGKEYHFSEEWEEQYMNERLGKPYEQVGKNIIEMLENNWTKKKFNSYTLIKGSVEIRDDKYWFVPYSEDNTEKNLSQAVRLYTYEVAVDGSVQRGENVLREGKCFINYNVYRVKLDSEEYSEEQYDYAVWYYDTYFEELFPWIAELNQEDILSVATEVREDWLSVDGAYRFGLAKRDEYKWSNEKIENFYDSIKNHYIKADDSNLNGALTEDIRYTFTVETTTGVYTVIYVQCSGERFFVQDNVYYKDIWNAGNALNGFAPNTAFDEKRAMLYFGNTESEAVKEYKNLDISFQVDYSYDGTKESDYILKIGEEILYVLDERHFLWTQDFIQRPLVWEVQGDVDFSEIFEDYASQEYGRTLIIQAYEEKYPQAGKATILHYCGIYGSDAIVAMIAGSDEGFDAAIWTETVVDYDFCYLDGNRIRVLYGDEFYTLTTAYENGYLTKENLKDIHTKWEI